MTSINVHRINLFEPEPKAIRSLAYDSSIFRLAVSRSDSSIEIWDVLKNPFLEKVIPAISGSSVETITWCNGRLFSAGLHGYVSEYDLISLSIKYEILVTSGHPIWCMSFNEQKTCLAVGNDYGHVMLYDISPEGLDFQKTFDKQEGRILCLAWHKNGQILVTGSIDAIRLWNTGTGHVVNRIILGRELRNTPTVCWCIAITNDMTIISGDSCGKTCFWDGHAGTLLFASNIHKGDVLALSLNKGENRVYAAGVDPLITAFERTSADGGWLKAFQKNVHTHDVRALVVLDTFLASGGDDCNLVFIKYPPPITIKFFPFCQMSYASVASAALCLLLRYPKHLEVWKFGNPVKMDPNLPKNLLQIKTKENEAIICCAISDDGKWLAYSSQRQIRLFNVKMEMQFSYSPSIYKAVFPSDIPQAAKIMLFTSDSSKLIFNSGNEIFILLCDVNEPKLLTSFQENSDSAGETYLMDLTPDNKYLACGSHNGSVIIYSLDTQKVYSKLPLYNLQPSTLKFDPASENLIVAYCDRTVIKYNLESQAYSAWSKRNNLTHLKKCSRHPITSIAFISNKLYLQDEDFIYIFDRYISSAPSKKRARKSKNTDESEAYDFTTVSKYESAPSKKRARKSKNTDESEAYDFTIVSKYEHISSIHSCGDDLVVVQISSNHILQSLPPPIYKKRYGT